MFVMYIVHSVLYSVLYTLLIIVDLACTVYNVRCNFVLFLFVNYLYLTLPRCWNVCALYCTETRLEKSVDFLNKDTENYGTIQVSIDFLLSFTVIKFFNFTMHDRQRYCTVFLYQLI